MKSQKIICLFIILPLLAACTGLTVKDDANSKATAYLAGKGMGLTINKLAPKKDAVLTDSWKSMMARNTSPVMPGAEIVTFYNESAIALIGAVDDPYGLLGDLSVLLTLYGAQYSEDKQLVFAQDIPRPVLEFFQQGYTSGKRLAAK